MSDDNKWSKPAAPPPPLFLGEKERNLVKQVNDEVIERVVGQQVMYFPIDIEHTNYHPVYGEAIEKTFLPPVRVYARVEYGGVETSFMDSVTIDKKTTAKVMFHKRRLTEDQNLQRNIIKLIKDKNQELCKYSYGVYETQYESDFCYIKTYSSKVQEF